MPKLFINALVILSLCFLLPVSDLAFAQAEKNDPPKEQDAKQTSDTQGETAEKEKSPPAHDAPWKSLFEDKMQELNAINTDIDNATKKAPDIVSQADKDMSYVNGEMNKILSVYKTSNTPTEAVSAFRFLEKLMTESSTKFATLRAYHDKGKDIKSQLDSWQSTVKQYTAGQLEPEDATLIQNLQSYLNRMVRKNNVIQASIDRVYSRLLEQQKELKSNREQIQTALPQLWINYYLQVKSVFMASEWKDLPGAFENWGKDFSDALEKFASMPLEAIQDFTLKSALLAILFLLLSWYFLHKIVPIEATDGLARKRNARFGAVFLSLGLAIYLAQFYSTTNESVVFLSAFGVIFLARGEMDLVWGLRRRVSNYTSPPMEAQFWLFTSYLLLLMFKTPLFFLSIYWIIAQVLAFLWTKKKTTEAIPGSMNYWLLSISKVMIFISFLLIFLGLMNLSFLLTVLWFVTAVGIEWGVYLSGRINATIASLSKKSETSGLMLFAKSMLAGLGTPLVWLAVLVVEAHWLTILFGGIYIVYYMADLGFAWGSISINFLWIFGLLGLYYLTKVIVHLGKYFLQELASKWGRIEANLIPSLQTIMTYVIWLIYFLIVLSVAGVSLTSITVIAGGLSVGVGFGMQNIMNNFVSGLILLFGQAVHVGDIVQFGDIMGRVQKITIRTTIVETFDEGILFVPNSEMVSSRLLNWTKNGQNVSRDVRICVILSTDVEKARKIMLKIAEENENVLSYPAPVVILNEFSSSCLDFILRVFVNINNAQGTCSALRLDIHEAFKKAGIALVGNTKILGATDDYPMLTKISGSIALGNTEKKPLPELPAESPAKTTPSDKPAEDSAKTAPPNKPAETPGKITPSDKPAEGSDKAAPPDKPAGSVEIAETSDEPAKPEGDNKVR